MESQMKLKKLLKEIPLEFCRGNKEVIITGLSENSKTVAPGNLFIAKKRCLEEGAKYIEEAISAGAHAILSPSFNPFLKDVAQLVHPDIPSICGKLADVFYGHPSQHLFVVGVTGTNGKTTVTYLLKHLLDSFKVMTGVIGTVEYIIGSKRCTAEMTTPDVVSNHKMLKEMLSMGCQAAAMEVSSHGLMQRRIDEIDVDVAVFTNLTQDHLDYHKTFEAYAEAKRKLFLQLSQDKVGIVYNDSPWTSHIIKGFKGTLFTYGFSRESDLYAHDIQFSYAGTTFKATFRGETEQFSWPSMGKFNVLNALAALLVMITKGYSLKDLKDPLSKFCAAPGRLERIKNSLIFVDYAHTPDALENVLMTLKEFKKGKMITVFGCGGERDIPKRPLMAAISEKYSDLTVVTSDNPRSENPRSIICDIEKGFTTKKYFLIPDRREAIKHAILQASDEDLILIAGKGHETYQIYAHQRLPFDDRKVAEDILTQKGK